MLPNFIIAGVARCGTTSLFHYLNQHPEIGMSKVKEPKYFSSLDLSLPQKGVGDETVYSKVVTNEADYDNLFKDLNKDGVIGEGSSDCFYYHEAVIPRIKSKLGDPKIIICLRNPIDRAYSAYSNLIRDSRETLSFSEGLEAEQERINANWDWMWHYKNGSLYAKGVENYTSSFSQVKVVLFDDLESNPKATLKSVFEFLGVDPNVDIDVSTRYSHSGKPKSKLISLLTSRKNPIIFWSRELALKLIPRKYLEKMAASMFEKEDVDAEVKSKLQAYFKADIIKLQNLINRDLKKWI